MYATAYSQLTWPFDGIVTIVFHAGAILYPISDRYFLQMVLHEEECVFGQGAQQNDMTCSVVFLDDPFNASLSHRKICVIRV